MEFLVPFELGLHLGMLVRRIVFDDQVEFSPSRGLTVDLVEEADEFLMPMARHALADDPTLQHVEGGEQCRRAVAFVDAMGARQGMRPWRGNDSRWVPHATGERPEQIARAIQSRHHADGGHRDESTEYKVAARASRPIGGLSSVRPGLSRSLACPQLDRRKAHTSAYLPFHCRAITVRTMGLRRSKLHHAIVRPASFIREVNNSRAIKIELEWNPSEPAHSFEKERLS
jgi:hypothetical protein